MDPVCNWCGDDMHNGAFRVEITKGDELKTVVKTLTLCKKCVRWMLEPMENKDLGGKKNV